MKASVSVDDSILAHISQGLLQHVSQRDAQRVSLPSITRWVVAYSGGVDSTVLLHALVAAVKQSLLPFSPSSIVAVHINHQLSPQANQWQQHCQQVTARLGVEFYTEQVVVNSSGKGIEAAARDARYEVFERFLQPNDCLLLGHHQADQVETVLLRLLRGAGVKGLSAMPVSRVIGQATLLRPLLFIGQNAIVDYAQQQQLAWVDDESNQCDVYDRNFLRNQVLPLLAQRWPTMPQQLTKMAATMKQTDELLSDIAEEDLRAVDYQQARTGYCVNFSTFNHFSLARKNNLLRYWCEKVGYALPDVDQLAEIETQFFSRSALLSSACVSWGQYELRQFAGRLYLMESLPAFTPPEMIEWDGVSEVDLQGAGCLSVVNNNVDHYQSDVSSNCIAIEQKPYHIRWRKGGERCTPSNRQHSQTVKKLLQEYALETWLRDRVPLIYDGDELVAVGDLWVNKGFDVEEDKPVACIKWSASYI